MRRLRVFGSHSLRHRVHIESDSDRELVRYNQILVPTSQSYSVKVQRMGCLYLVQALWVGLKLVPR